MCGIVGYTGKKNAVPILLEGLRRLEYRGYDSAGIAVSTKKGTKIVKLKGKVRNLEDKLLSNPLIGHCGIAHTRWATHGKPSAKNAHPFKYKNFSIVHNGIIENWQSVKDELLKSGYKFTSDTDTEVALLCFYDLYKKTGITGAVTMLHRKLKGMYSFLFIDEKKPDEIIGIKSGNPLVVGENADAVFAASDITALLPFTKRAYFMEDNQFFIANGGSLKFYNFNGKKIEKKSKKIKWNVEEAKKDGYKHYLLKEIMEQPDNLNKAMAGRLNLFADELPGNIVPKGRILCIACGTSYNAALCFKYFFNMLTGKSITVENASEFRYQPFDLTDNSLVIVLSQSGETSDTKEALSIAKKAGANTLAIVNSWESSIARMADNKIYMNIGPEISVASTKAYSAEVMLLYLLSLRIAGEIGVSKEEIQMWKDKLSSVPSSCAHYLSNIDAVKTIAEKYYKKKNFFFIGRGIGYPIAVEGALKLKELSYIHAESYSAGEMKHGPISLIDNDFSTIAVAPDNKQRAVLFSNIEEIKSRMGQILLISDKPLDGCDYLKMPKINDWLSPFIYILPLQLLSYYIANLLGNDVDQPRNLAKSVTVE